MKLFNHVGLDPIEMSAEMVDGKRVYLTPTGDKFPSVTTVISNNKEKMKGIAKWRARIGEEKACLLYTSPSPRDKRQSRMPSSA